MPELIREVAHPVLKGTLQQWWRVGPLKLTLEIAYEIDRRYKHFDEEECWVAYNRIVDRGGEYDDSDLGNPKFAALCKALNIPHIVEDNKLGQLLFYIPSADKMRFMEALEAQVEREGL